MKLMDQPSPVLLQIKPRKANLYGVEIEFENFNGEWKWKHSDTTMGQAHWDIVTDHSLRNGGELVSTPLTQPSLNRALQLVENALAQQNFTVSKRCSVHVHVSMLNMTWGQIWSTIMAYTFVEPELFAIFGPERIENHFCVPAFHNTRLLQDLKQDATKMRLVAPYKKPEAPATAKRRAVRSITTTKYTVRGNPIRVRAPVLSEEAPDIDDLEDSLPPAITSRAPHASGGYDGYPPPVKSILRAPGKAKYCACSLFRLPDLGTLEFRMLPGTLDTKLIQQWVKTLGRIKHLGAKYLDPLTLQEEYETRGIDWLWKNIMSVNRPVVDPAHRSDAAEAAFMISGDPEVKSDKLSWKIGE